MESSFFNKSTVIIWVSFLFFSEIDFIVVFSLRANILSPNIQYVFAMFS